jgi:glycosyltransferase involved in cell wall biosynthesis
VDDASHDESAERIASRFGGRVRLIRNDRNLEKSASRNRGVRECGTEFVSFLDSDDVLTPDSVADRMRIFTQDPEFNGVAFGACIHENRQHSEPPATPAVLSLDDYLGGVGELRTNGFLLRRDVMLTQGMYNETLTNREDIELFIRLLSQLEFRSSGTVASIYRSGGSARARDNWQNIIRQGTALTDALAQDRPVMSVLGSRYRQLRSDEYRELLRALYRSEQYRRYRSVYTQARGEGVLPFSAKDLRRYALASVFAMMGAGGRGQNEEALR